MSIIVSRESVSLFLNSLYDKYCMLRFVKIFHTINLENSVRAFQNVNTSKNTYDYWFLQFRCYFYSVELNEVTAK